MGWRARCSRATHSARSSASLRAVNGSKILVLAKRPPALRWGDALRLVNFARHWRERHALSLLAFFKPAEELDEASRAVFQRIDLLPYPLEEPRSWSARVQGSFSARHFMPSSEAMRACVAERLRSRACDAILDLGGLMLDNLPPGPLPVPLVVDSIDEPLVTLERELEQAPWSRRPALLRKRQQYRDVNRRIHERADVNVYASDLDCDVYRREFPNARALAIPNGVDTAFFHPASGHVVDRAPPRIGFEGNMAYPPNVDAAVFLCREILPRVAALVPGVGVDVIGRDPTDEVLALAGPSVRVTGTLADVREALWGCAVFACPMRLGAGIKNKVLQAWALGLPVVASSAAMGGLMAREGENVLVRDDAEAIARAIAEVLRDSRMARRLGDGGRATALEHYDWAKLAARFEALFTRASSGRVGQPE